MKSLFWLSQVWDKTNTGFCPTVPLHSRRYRPRTIALAMSWNPVRGWCLELIHSQSPRVPVGLILQF
jgi:hypothetical protein